MGKLYVIRHSEVLVQPELAPEQWRLSDAGRILAKTLSEEEQWSDVRLVYHSPQPKAQETASILAGEIGVPVKEVQGLQELSMNTGFLSPAEFRQRVGDYLSGRPDPDFEKYGEAMLRIVGTFQDIVRELNGSSGVVVSHGRILSVFFSYLLGRRITVDEWQSMKFPELSVIDINTWRIERGFLAQVKPKSAVDANVSDSR